MCGVRDLKTLREYPVKWAEKAKFIFAQKFDPTDAFHVLEQRFQIRHVMDFHLPEQRSIAVQSEMRQRRDQKVLAKDEFLHRPAPGWQHSQ